MDKNEHVTIELIALYISTFLLRIGFAASLILFDWILVWSIDVTLGQETANDFGPILLTSFAGITFLIAEIFLTGYYGHRADKNGPKPILIWATFGAAFVLLLYSPASLILIIIKHGVLGVLTITLYLAVIHFFHGVFASGKVSPTLGFINFHSDESNRALRMAYYDNAVLYARAVGMPFGGFLWIFMKVDENGISVDEQAKRIAMTFPVLSLLLIVAGLIIIVFLKNTPGDNHVKPYSMKEDVTLAARVMLEDKRRPLLVPWLALSAIIGSISLWGPSIAFRSENQNESRALNALVPIIVIILTLAIPAPFWGWYADHHGRKKALNLGILGLPVLFVGAAVGFPFYHDQISLSNIKLLLSVVPGIMLISALVPVLMGYLGDTAEKGIHDDGKVMSGYHFIIAMGEIIGILVGGMVIGVFAILYDIFGILGSRQTALLVGFLVFELILIILVIRGILKIPKDIGKIQNKQ